MLWFLVEESATWCMKGSLYNGLILYMDRYIQMNLSFKPETFETYFKCGIGAWVPWPQSNSHMMLSYHSSFHHYLFILYLYCGASYVNLILLLGQNSVHSYILLVLLFFGGNLNNYCINFIDKLICFHCRLYSHY
jgi:hypothetical protein